MLTVFGDRRVHSPPRWALFAALAASLLAAACQKATSPPQGAPSEKRVGVLLVNHGSRSAAWRKELLRLEDNVRPRILEQPGVVALTTAFMEYTEPSIATRLRELDARGVSDVVIVPVFLTVSTHSFDDIPTIVGQKDDPKSRELMRLERIERYKPRARVHLAPLLDFADILQRNLLRRAKAMSTNAAQEGLVLIAYGDKTYEKEWTALMDKAAAFVRREAGIAAHAHGWCGHLVHYDPRKTTAAVEAVLAKKERALVLPVLVAHDEMFQLKIIGGGIERVKDHRARVVYRADAILPDPGVEDWVVDIASRNVREILGGGGAALAKRQPDARR